jgi:hypothetical protein
MKATYYLREVPDSAEVVLDQLEDAMPPQHCATHPTITAALEATTQYRWIEVDDAYRAELEIAGDVLFIEDL